MKYFFITVMLLAVFATASGGETKKQEKQFLKRSNIKKTMLKAAEWQLENPRHKLTDWTNGAFYSGIFAAWETTKSPKLMKAMNTMGESNEWKPGTRLHHADDHAICQTYVDLYRVEGKKEMIEPFTEMLGKFMATPFNTKGIEKITWWWCDALFMAPPAFVKLGVTLKEPKYFELTDSLFMECYNFLYDKEERLYARDMNYKWNEPEIQVRKEANGEKIFWSRGNGWVLAGLAKVMDELPKNYKNRAFYEQNFKEMAARIASLQQPDGLWRASLLDPDSYPGGEASGSGFFCYALAWGINNGLLDKSTYLPVVRKAWIGLNLLIQPSGGMGWVQPIGADPRKNFSAESWEVYGTGAFLLAGSEVIKL
ncbi:MAG: glycoside hydrolase family 88 protein [Prolixibacteraceae bacterium]|nr:glycoside hydrolase family 88 protein [Prolixibacteraceae bacterium]